MDYFQCLYISLMYHPHSEGWILHELSLDSTGCENHNPCIPCILAVLEPAISTQLNHIYTSKMSLDTIFYDKEPCTHHQRNNILDWHFGVPIQINSTSLHTRRVTASGLLCKYSITLPQTHPHSTLQSHAIDNILEYLLPLRLPWNMALQVQNKSAQTNSILNTIT